MNRPNRWPGPIPAEPSPSEPVPVEPIPVEPIPVEPIPADDFIPRFILLPLPSAISWQCLW